MKKVNKTVLNKRGYPRLSKQQVEYYKRLCLITGRLPLYVDPEYIKFKKI